MEGNEKQKLTDKQELFCQEYLIDLNATQAAIRAGYSEDSARSSGSRMLTNVDIRARIGELMDERNKRTLVHQDFVVYNLVEVSQRCLQKVPVMVFDPINKAMAQKQDEEGRDVWEFDSNGANRALELLGKHLKMFTDKIQDDGTKELIVKVLYGDKGDNANKAAPGAEPGTDGSEEV